jgi:hypothetical protein
VSARARAVVARAHAEVLAGAAPVVVQ